MNLCRPGAVSRDWSPFTSRRRLNSSCRPSAPRRVATVVADARSQRAREVCDRPAIRGRRTLVRLATMAWLPLSKRHDAEAAKEYDALHEGVPEWLAAPVAQWVFDVFSSMLSTTTTSATSWTSSTGCFVVRCPRRAVTEFVRDSITELGNAAANGDLDVLDAVVWTTQLSREGWKLRERLDLLLLVHGSAWTVGENAAEQPCLLRRVDETVTSAAKAEMEQEGNAARHLHRAGHPASTGETRTRAARAREAVRARGGRCQADRCSSGLGRDPRHDARPILRNKPDKWSVALNEGGRAPGVNLLIEMCAGLWKLAVRPSRHG